MKPSIVINNPSEVTKAGWYVPNSVNVRDIVPEWRISGGGVETNDMTDSLSAAFKQAIAYTEQHIRTAEPLSHCKT